METVILQMEFLIFYTFFYMTMVRFATNERESRLGMLLLENKLHTW